MFSFLSVTAINTIQLDFPLKNVTTKYRTQLLRLRCEITGRPIPEYRWYKDGQQLQSSGRISIKPTVWGSR